MPQKALGILLADQSPDSRLMNGIDERVQRDHDDPAHALVDQVLNFLEHLLVAQRNNHIAKIVDALLNADDQGLRDQRLRPLGAPAVILLLGGQAVAPIACAADLDGVLEPLGRDEAEPCAATLDQRIRADGGRIDDAVRRLQRLLDLQAGLLRGHARRVEEADLEIVVGRVGLAAEQQAVVDANHVGKCAADVYAETYTHRPSPGRRPLQTVLAAQRLDIDLHVPRQRMARRQVLGLDQSGA